MLLSNGKMEIAKKNELIRRIGTDLEVKEQKIVTLLINKIEREDIALYEQEFTMAELVWELGIPEGGTTREHLKKFLDGLLERVFWYRPPVTPDEPIGKEISLHWVQTAEIWDDNRVTLHLDPNLANFLLGINKETKGRKKGNFTLLDPRYIQHFKTRFASPIYEFLQSYAWTNKGGNFVANMKPDELRALVNCRDKLQKFEDFKLKAIEPAIRDINNSEYTGLYVTAKYQKVGKAIGNIAFHCTIRTKTIGSEEEDYTTFIMQDAE